MKQSKQSKPKASRKGSEANHEPVVDTVVEPYTVIIHDPELKRIIEERKMAEEEKKEEPIVEEPVLVLEQPIIEILLEEPAPESELVVEPVDEYVAKYSQCNTKVLNPSSGRYVACDGPIAKKLNLLRKHYTK